MTDDVIGRFKPGWLLRQLEKATEEVDKWPEWKKEAMRIDYEKEANG